MALCGINVVLVEEHLPNGIGLAVRFNVNAYQGSVVGGLLWLNHVAGWVRAQYGKGFEHEYLGALSLPLKLPES